MKVFQKFYFKSGYHNLLSNKNITVSITELQLNYENSICESKDFFSSANEQYKKRKHLNNLWKNMNLRQIQEFYQINGTEIQKKVHFFKRNYNSSLFYCLADLYPEINWIAWNFRRVPNSFWNNTENQTAYLKYLEKKLNFKSMEDWYQISSRELVNFYARYDSMYHLLSSIYPNYLWNPTKFFYLYQIDYFTKLQNAKLNRRNYFVQIAKNLKIKLLQDWYNVKLQSIYKQKHTKFVHTIYNSNLLFCFSDLNPEYLWRPWFFYRVPEGFWEKDENVLQFLQWFEIHFKMKSKQDWYFVTTTQFQKFCGSLLNKWKTISSLLQKYYPEEKWDSTKFYSVTTNIDVVQKK